MLLVEFRSNGCSVVLANKDSKGIKMVREFLIHRDRLTFQEMIRT